MLVGGRLRTARPDRLRRAAAVAGTLLLLGVAGSTSLGASASTSSGPPVNTAPPTVDGLARAGETLTASTGSWTGSQPLGYAYQWLRCGAGYAQLISTRGPLGHWRLGETSGSTATDASGRGHNGSYGGSFALGQAGALALDADPAVRLGSGSSTGTMSVSHRGTLNAADAVTYELWLQLLRRPSSSAGIDLLAKGSGPLVLRVLPSGVLTLRRGGGNELARSTSALAVDGAYHHVVAVKAGSLVRIYVDGVDVTGPVANATLSNSSSALTLRVAELNALVDELAVYGRGLSAAEVAASYTSGRDGACTPLDGATDASYALGADDVGGVVRVQVTASNALGSGSALSAPTSAIAPPAPPTSTAPPTVDGLARWGETLTASPGTWEGTQPIGHEYRWERCGPGYSGVVSAAAPIGYWRLGETSGSTATDVSGQGHHGGYAGSHALGRPGAIAFDADSAVRLGGAASGSMSVPHRASLSYGNSVTYEAWLRVLRLPTSSSGADLITKGSGTLLLRLLPSGELSLRRAGGNQLTRSTVALPVDGAYHHVAAVKANSAIRLYVDGVDVTGSVSNESLSGSSSPLTLAASGMEAEVDELALYSRGLSAAEVAAAYAAGRDGVCATVVGAAGESYLLGPDDVGKALRVHVTATNVAGSAAARSAPTDVVAGPDPPVSAAPPALSGLARAGETLSATRGTWTGSEPLSYAYQWRRCDAGGSACAPIAGAVAATYVLAAADVGATVRAAVTAENAGGSATAVSSASAVVAAAPVGPVNTAAPTVSGEARVGETLTAAAGEWSGTQPLSYAFQWRRCDAEGAACGDVQGATAETYSVDEADVGATLRVAVTASNVAGTATAASAPTATVAGPPSDPEPDPDPPVSTAAPSVSGSASVGGTLTASPGSWSGTQPLEYAYGWRRCGSGYAALVQSRGPVAYWRFGESGGTTAGDASGRGNDGTYGGTFALGQQGAPALDPNRAVRVGWASPPGSIAVAHRSSLNVGDAVTYETWIRLLRLPSGTIGANIAAKGNGTLVLRILPSGELHVRKSSGTLLRNSTAALAADGRYHHVVAVKAGSDVRLYLDGVDVTGEVLGNDTLGNSSAQLLIAGSSANDGRDAIDGFLDEFALYGRALTPEEVAEHYAAGREGVCETISGATSDTYVPVAADAGKALGVEVTATNAAGSASARSELTDLVDPGGAPASVAPPSVTGVLQAAETLSATAGTWTGAPPIEYAYQWQRCDGGACADIPGATGASYTLGVGDMGGRFRVAVTASNGAGTSTAASASTAAVAFGYAGPSAAGVGERPTASKPQSKLWWNDGSWWVSMWSAASNSYSIFRLDLASQTWVDTGTLIDSRPGTRADALWDGTHLYLASHVLATCGCSTPGFGQPSLLYRYSYDAATGEYSLDEGFPAAINDTHSESLVIDKDSTGTLWATWAQENKVFVSHTVGDDLTWATPFALPHQAAQSLTADDISSLVALGGDRIGVLWSNQNANTMYFSVHADGDSPDAWQAPEIALTGTKYADDHINLHGTATGRVLVAMKTSRDEHPGAPSSDPQMMLLDRSASGTWTAHAAGTVGDDHTRPIVQVDEQSGTIHLFATAPTTPGGTIYHKTSPLDAISFAPGLGTPFIRGVGGSGVSLNDATSTKQAVNATTGVVVVASERPGSRYWHNHLALAG